MRKKASKVMYEWARCTECAWGQTAVGSLGAAARHHDDTGHVVEASQTLHVRYGVSRILRHNLTR